MVALLFLSPALTYAAYRCKLPALRNTVLVALGFGIGAVADFLLYFVTYADKYPLHEQWGRSNWVVSIMVISLEAAALALVAFAAASLTYLLLRLFSREPGAV